MIKWGLVRIASRTEEEYAGRSYEAWNIEPIKAPPNPTNNKE
jgi:hypothetical protein